MQIFRKLVTIFAIGFFVLPLSVNAQYIEDQDYRRIDAGISKNNQSVEVVEFFSYACPYCARVEMPLQVWDEMKPENVTFTRVAIPRRGRSITYAKAFYALQAIDPVLEQRLALEIIKTVVYHKINLDNDDAFVAWAETQGVDRTKLATLMASKEIEQQVEAALKLSEQYGVPSVPAIYVDGRYHLIDNNTYYEKIPLILNALIEQVEVERKQDAQGGSTLSSNSPAEANKPATTDDILSCTLDANANSCE